MKVQDAIDSYVAARNAAFEANALTVSAAAKAYRAKRELCHAEAQIIHAANEVAKANAAHKEAESMEKWADDAVTRAKAALSTAVQENV